MSRKNDEPLYDPEWLKARMQDKRYRRRALGNGLKPYDPGDPWWSKFLAVLMVPVWHVVGWINDRIGRAAVTFWAIFEPVMIGPFLLFATIGTLAKHRAAARAEAARIRRLDIRQARLEGHA